MVHRRRIILSCLVAVWAGLILACSGTSSPSSGKAEKSAKPATQIPDGNPSTAESTPSSTEPIKNAQDPPPPSSTEPIKNAQDPPPPNVEKKWPYQFVESKTEQTGHRNVMDLYAFSGDFDPTELKAFCRERKEKSPAKHFYYVVIFDKASNAKFPTTPFTAKYGTDDEVAKHIRAIYVYNQLNGFSELSYHAQNIHQHIPTREKIQ